MKSELKTFLIAFLTGIIVSLAVYYFLCPRLKGTLPEKKNDIQLKLEEPDKPGRKELEDDEKNSIKSVQRTEEKSNSDQELRKPYSATASYYTTDYCKKYNPSCLTASGEVFTNEGLTAACAGIFPLGTKILLTSDQGSVEVRCNDRGGFEKIQGRMFDLTPTAFAELAPLSKGIVKVSYQILK
jgi:rare lipoprotein A (peptidoglycan hydrolase)